MRTPTRREEIKHEIMEACGGGIFASKSKLCSVFNIGEKNLDEFLSGTEYWLRGNRKYYLISDIAGRIYYSMACSVDRYSYSAPRRPDQRGMAYSQITNELIRFCNEKETPEWHRSPFGTSDQICKALGIGKKDLKLIFGDIEFLQAGRRKLYLLSDITNHIRASRGKTQTAD